MTAEIETAPAKEVPGVARRGGPARRRPASIDRPRAYGSMPLPLALAIAAASGAMFSLAFPSPDVWILAFPAVGGLLAAQRGRSAGGGFLTGLVGGVAFWFTLIPWVTLFLGPLPLLALGTLEALMMGFGGMLISLAYGSIGVLWPNAWGRLGLAPLIVAAAWTAREVIAGTAPYGGFAWGRVSLSQSTSPFAPLAAWFGLSGLTFVLVWVTAFALACCVEPRIDLAGRLGRLPLQDLVAATLRRMLGVALAALALLSIPSFPPQVVGYLAVAGVQPVTHAGYFDPLNDPIRNLDDTVQATLPAVGSGASFVIWPEGASTVDPLTSAAVQARLNGVVSLTGVPLLTGAITHRGGRYYNSSLLWQEGQGATAVYDKVHPVPFGEYVPDRAFWEPLAPQLIGLVGRDYTIGTRSSVLKVNGEPIGVDICFDIADDGLILGSVADGAQMLVAQTNNADFGHTEENEQQLAIARLRSIETGRSIFTVSTVASTTAIGPTGATIGSIAPFHRGVLVARMPLATGVTPADAFGVPLGAALAVLGIALPIVTAAITRRAAGRKRPRDPIVIPAR